MLVFALARDIFSGKFKGPPIITYNKRTETRDKVSYTVLGNAQFHAQTELNFPWFSSASPYSWRNSISIQATTTSFHSTQFTILYIFYHFIYRLTASLYKPYTINHYCLLRSAWKGLNVLILRKFNPLKAELNPICHLLALLRAHHIFHVSGLRVKSTLYW